MLPHRYQSIDPHVLLQAVGNDAASFRELSRTFLRIAPPMLARLEDAVRAGDNAVAALESHSLKSTASLVGAHMLVRMCADLDALLRRDEWTSAAQALSAMAVELAQVMREVLDSIRSTEDSSTFA